MGRLRLTLLVSAVFLFLPLGLLVHRALETVDSERALRHQIIAERFFDEAERELTTFLRREEERPFEHYRYYYVAEGDGGRSPSLVRSPLADLPAEPFVIGYFQVDSAGEVSTPLIDGPLLPTPVPGWEPSQALHRAVTVIRALVGQHWRDVGGNAILAPPAERGLSGTETDAASTDYLRALNRGASSRQHRASQNVLTSSMNVLDPGVAPTVPRPSRPVRVLLGPMKGLSVGEGRFFLYREALADGTAYRQGLILEVAPLIQWLEQRVVSGGELEGRARLLPPRDGDLETLSRTSYFRWRHRFAEPFEGVESTLVLAPLPETSGATYVHWLSALLVLTALAGLYGLYRMVSTQLSFAEKRQAFVSAVSHELRTPLTAIRMHAEMLRDGAVVGEDKRRHYYAVITRESERLTRLVNNVLELARLDRREPRPTPSRAPLHPALREAVEALEPHARSEGFDLALQVEGDLPDVDYERDGLLQVLFNLVDNAVKYGGTESRREILIEARARGQDVEITVGDAGRGIAQEDLKHVFEPFFRAAAPGPGGAKGSGMGLALVRRLVESMGGSVHAESPLEGGFAVHILLKNPRHSQS